MEHEREEREGGRCGGGKDEMIGGTDRQKLKGGYPEVGREG
jgi:hypothetical protein